MRLLLTSNGWKNNLRIKNEFLELVKNKKPSEMVVLFVNIAKKEDSDWKYVTYHIKEMKKIGILKKNIIIINPDNEKKYPENIDVIYFCGGNTFHYMDMIRKTELDKKIKKLIKQGVFYFGISAGSILVGPSIEIAQTCSGDENDVGLKDLTGLKITQRIISPHYLESDEKEINDFEKNGKKVYKISDGQAVLLLKQRITFIK
jgi:dipeptidase E